MCIRDRSGAGRESLQSEAPELIPVAMIELERLRRSRAGDKA